MLTTLKSNAKRLLTNWRSWKNDKRTAERRNRFIAKALIGLNAKIDFERDCAELDSNDIDHIAEQIGKELYNMGYRMIDGKENEILTAAVDATFRGAVLRLAEKLKQCSYCDNCFKDGKWHRYVFIEDIDATVKKFLESET